MGRIKRLVGVAATAAIVMAGTVSMASADHNVQHCPDHSTRVTDTVGDPKTVEYTAPEGFLVAGYCVKAGSENQGDGPEFIEVDPPAKTVIMAYPSGKAISHWSVLLVPEPDPVTPVNGVVSGLKYYDANANGQLDATEDGIPGWNIDYVGGVRDTLVTDAFGAFSVSLIEDEYVFTEQQAPGWIQTGNIVNQTSDVESATLADKSYTVNVVDGSVVSGLNFGNLCVGAGNGRTLGFWSNKNGQALVDANDRAALIALNLRNATGTHFDPGSNAALRTWLLNGNATNMAYMLSVQLAAMQLNVLNGFVTGDSLIQNGAGFATVNDVMTAANAALGANGNTTAAGPARTLQEGLKNALDAANNNISFVQPTRATCPALNFPVPV